MSNTADSIPRRTTGVRIQAIIGATLFLLMVFLLFMSSRTGQAEFNAAKQQLDHIDATNLRLDAAMFWSMFELQMDFDLLTDLQRELTDLTRNFTATLSDRDSVLIGPVEEKLALVDDFKTQQAVLRNSRSIATEMIAEFWRQPEIRTAGAARDLFAVERAFLNFTARRDPASADQLRAAIDNFDARQAELAALERWQMLEAHLLTLVRYVDNMTQLMQQLFLIPVPSALASQADALARRLSTRVERAGRYRTALFVVALLLLVFSGFMVARVRRYLRMIEQANEELESRVAERTRELADVNEALHAEIVERESVESQLQIARKLESVGALAAGIAHEVNTPAQYVSDNITFLESVWEEIGPLIDDYERSLVSGSMDVERSRKIWQQADVPYLRAEVPAALHQAANGLQQIGKIVLAMKHFSHPGSEDLQPIDLNKAIESTVTIARNEWKYVAELTLDLDPDLPSVPCNASAVNQAVLNLVVNAAQALAEQRRPDGELGHIEVCSRYASEWAEISIDDDGPGVPESIRDRIFDPFFTTKEVGKGTGQGLAIAHRIIHQQHGGTLTLEAKEGRGARFVVRLPLDVSESDDESSAPASFRATA